MVDLTRDEQARLHARPIDVVPDRSGTAYANWLNQQLPEFIAGIEHAALDPFRGYANAIRDELPDGVAVLDAFHVVKLGPQGRRRGPSPGPAGDAAPARPQARPALQDPRAAATRRREPHRAASARLEIGLRLGDPHGGVDLAWQCYQQLRAAYRAKLPAEGQRVALKIISTCARCPVPEIARLGRSLRQWRQQVLAYFTTKGVSNGGTEAINLLIADASRPYRERPNHAQ